MQWLANLNKVRRIIHATHINYTQFKQCRLFIKFSIISLNCVGHTKLAAVASSVYIVEAWVYILQTSEILVILKSAQVVI